MEFSTKMLRSVRKRGVRQGYPLSGLLFMIGIEILGNAIRNSNAIEGIDICCDLELTLRDIGTLHSFQVTCYVFASVLNKSVCVISCTWLVITFWRRGFHSRFEQEWRPTGK